MAVAMGLGLNPAAARSAARADSPAPELLDRVFDRGQLVALVMDDADQSSRRGAEEVDAPGVVLLRARFLGHQRSM